MLKHWSIYGNEKCRPSKAALRRLDRALDELAELPTATEVARFLERRGIKGERGNCATCPIAAYLTEAVGTMRVPKGAQWRVEVGTDLVRVVVSVGAYYMAAASRYGSGLPVVVNRFISRFDSGWFKALCASDDRRHG